MKKLIIIFVLFMMVSYNFGSSLLDTMAEEPSSLVPSNRFYTSMEIHEGDSLWSIAETYSIGSGLSTANYVEELKKMNNLKEDVIHKGHYLTVMYYD